MGKGEGRRFGWVVDCNLKDGLVGEGRGRKGEGKGKRTLQDSSHKILNWFIYSVLQDNL